MQTERFPITIVIAAASAWGLFWLPLRAFEENGLSAGWTTLAVFVTPVLVLFPFAAMRLLRGHPWGGANVAAGLLADYLVRPETEDRLAMGDSSQLPISRGSKFPPRVLPDHPVRWMHANFEDAADDWETWAGELQELFSSSQ